MSTESVIAISAVIQALGSVIVGATAYYSIKNATKTLGEMQRDREYSFIPILKIEAKDHVEKIGDIWKYKVSIKNIGKGIAQELDIKLPAINDLSDSKWTLEPNEPYYIIFNLKEIDKIMEKSIDERKLTISYSDLFNNKFMTTAILYIGKGHVDNQGWEVDRPFLKPWEFNLPN